MERNAGERPMQWNVADLFEGAVDAAADREALVCGAARLRYAALDERANRFAHHLRGRGVGPGEHVGILAWNRAEWVESMLGCFKVRAVPINVNYRYVERELLYLFDNADLVALVHQRAFAPRIAPLRGELPKLRHLVALEDGSGEDLGATGSVPYEEALASASPKREFGPRSPDDHYVIYTGGTTGMPKGVVWRQEDVIMALGGGIDHATGIPATRPEELVAKTANPPLTTLVLPPLMHGAAQWATLGFLFVGSRVVLNEGRSLDADRVWALIEAEGVNTVSITGDAMARPLAESLARDPKRHDLSRLGVLASSAAIFSPSVKAQLKALLPQLLIVDSLGASETGFHGSALWQGEGAPRREGAGVSVRPGRDTLVLDDALRPVAAGSRRVGRLARGGNVPLGYYKDAEKTAATFVEVEGRRYSIPGDFATVEEDGSITLLGRGSVSINTGGEKVYPEEVESALKSHDDVFDAVVVGVPDERWGERVAAVVEARPGRRPSLEALDAHCRDRLAGYKIPRSLVLVERIERQPSGKPDYPWAQRVARAPAGG
jgi:acyl-CoA synthetase (AMP-forming)/AMP-acid ligase II